MKPSLVAFSLALAALPLTVAAQQGPAYPPPPPLEAPPGYAQQQQPPPGYAPQYPPPGYAQQYPPGYAAQNGYRLSRPVLVPYEEGSPVPPGGRVITRPRVGLIVAGATTFGPVWLITALVGTAFSSDSYYGSGSQPELWLVAPVLGPFIYMGAADHLSGSSVFWLAFDGLVQAGGLAMLIAGIANPGRYVAYDHVASVAPRWMVAPSYMGGPGASLHMIF